MEILAIMCVGLLIGAKCFPERLKKWNERFQLCCTLLLIFAMGVTLGARENFLNDLASMGLTSLLFAVLPILGSIALVYPLTRRFLRKSDAEE